MCLIFILLDIAEKKTLYINPPPKKKLSHKQQGEAWGNQKAPRVESVRNFREDREWVVVSF